MTSPHPRQHLIDVARDARSRREAHELERRRQDDEPVDGEGPGRIGEDGE